MTEAIIVALITGGLSLVGVVVTCLATAKNTEKKQEIAQADIILGAERMISKYEPKLEKRPYYLASQIVPYLREQQDKMTETGKKVVILFSGDSGFYSGCEKLYQSLKQEVEQGNLSASLHILPGISSISFSFRISYAFELSFNNNFKISLYLNLKISSYDNEVLFGY